MNEDDVPIESPQAFSIWLEANRIRLHLILQQKIGERLRAKVECDDVLQEAASKAMQGFDDLRLTEREVMPWFLHVVNHTIIDLHRHHFGSQKRDASRELSTDQNSNENSDQPASLAELLVASITSPSAAFSQHIRMNRMHDALSQLPEDARRAIEWRFMHGLSSQEIADRLQKSDGAVRVLLSRTLKKLEELLADVRP